MSAPRHADVQAALETLKRAIVELLRSNPDGLSNGEIATQLDLKSDHLGRQKNYLTYSLLGLLLKDERVRKVGRLYQAADQK